MISIAWNLISMMIKLWVLLRPYLIFSTFPLFCPQAFSSWPIDGKAISPWIKTRNTQERKKNKTHVRHVYKISRKIERNMGWSIKKYSIKVRKKCTKKWRWPSRELKTWYMYNNIMGFLFTKKYFSYFDLYSWYGHLNV